MSKHSELVHLVAEAETARLILEALILRGTEGEPLRQAIDARTASLELLAEHLELVPSAPSAFVPACDKHVRPQRKQRNKNPAA